MSCTLIFLFCRGLPLRGTVLSERSLSMTDQERTQIVQLQKKGLGYKRIATQLNLPVNGVKSFCRRHPVNKDTALSDAVGCLQCGTPLTQQPHRKAKKFCSDKCRMAWWNTHQDQVNRKAYYQHIWPACGKLFESYGKEHRVYCSRACYAQARRKEVSQNG